MKSDANPKTRRPMLAAFCTVLCAGLIAVDQWLKWWTVANIPYTVPMGEGLPFIPFLLGLNHTHNTGGAWSILNSHTWILTAVSAVVVVVLLVALISRRFVRHPFGVISLTVVLAGAIGNLIDRVRLGYVVDMFETLFMDFPIFNVADICVVCGGIAFCVYYALLYDKWEQKYY